jgi:hypothetical protein
MAALASLLNGLLGMWRTQSDAVGDPADFGAYFLPLFSGLWSDNIAQRQSLPDGTKIVDVAYADIVDDPFGVMASVFDRHGHDFTPEAMRCMKEWEGANPQHRFGKYRYPSDLGIYGLSESDVRAAFEPYLSTFSELALKRPSSG